ncbi:MAG TPA: GNAT family N-acetyltransferase [Verrucomicrobiae bacterium]|nr:GNAT family N-acetyltransferase [Verrucomicrobiae bacterium]
MSFTDFIDRIKDYHSRHGLKATFQRAGLAGRRALFANRMVVYYCDLTELTKAPAKKPSTLKFERVTTSGELDRQRRIEIATQWNPRKAEQNIEERFARKASLWLVSSGDRLAGFGWTIRGKTIAPYYFPIGPDDIQLFDFYIFPKFRGRALHGVLTSHILRELAAEGAVRAFADTAEWNQAQLSSFKMTPFRQIGLAQVLRIPGCRIVSWVESEHRDGIEKKTASRKPIKLGASS